MCSCKKSAPQILTLQANQYYYAKGLKEESSDAAVEKFLALVSSSDQEENSEWIFKSYKQLAKISYQRQEYESVLQYIGELIRLLPRLNGNYAEESISKLLSRYSASPNSQFVTKMYDVIVSHLHDSLVSGASGHRLWLRININRLHNLLENNELEECRSLIEAINEKLETVSELTRNSYALVVIAAEIEFATKTQFDFNKLSLLYKKSALVSAAITHPRVMGVIKECGATLQFYRKNYEKARVEFYECFKSYDEAGSLSKKKVLKHLSLCSLLTESEVNPFESHETQSYTQLPEYRNLIDMVKTYESQDLSGFLEVIERIKEENDPLNDDQIYQNSVVQILHNLKVRVLLKYLEAYRTLRFDFLVRKLFFSGEDELEKIIVGMANSGMGPDLKLDFVDRYVEVSGPGSTSPFALTLDAKTVKGNLRILYEMSFNGKWSNSSGVVLTPMEVDDAPDTDDADPDGRNWIEPADESFTQEKLNLYELLFCNSLDQLDPNIDEEEWFQYVHSALATKTAKQLTQIDQVYSEQQEVSKESSDKEVQENDVADANTRAGILGSAVSLAHAEAEEEEEEQLSKLDLLQKWAYELSRRLEA